MALSRGQRRCTKPAEWIKHSIADEREHRNESLCNLDREWRRVIAKRLASNIVPDLPEPTLIVILVDQRQFPLKTRWLAVAARLAEHQYELDIVFNNSIRLVRFA